MVEGIVKKIMFTGIEKYAKNYGLTDLQVQIKVLNDENGSVTYKICKNYNEEEEGTHKHIGFIADDTPIELSSADQDKMDMSSTIGVLLKAVQELSAKVTALEAQLAAK